MSQQELEFRQEVRDGLSSLRELLFSVRHEVHKVNHKLDLLLKETVDPSDLHELSRVLDRETKDLEKAVLSNELLPAPRRSEVMSAHERKAAGAFDDLKTKVDKMVDAAKSAETVLNDLGQFMREHADEPAVIAAMGDKLTAESTSLATAVLANTPAAPPLGPQVSGSNRGSSIPPNPK